MSSLQQIIVRLIASPLSAEDTELAFTEVMRGGASDALTAALLVALRTRGETAEEIAGGVRAMRRAMIPVPLGDGADLVDTCGTGGGKLGTFNISTASALVAAGAGVRIAKHGNRSFSSRSGSADILRALGVEIELTPTQMADVFNEAGIVFMFAPLLHPAMKHVGQVRRELGVATIMNVLGPLANPAGARRQLVGVSDAHLLDMVAAALRELGHVRALVVHGAPGMDELSPMGHTQVIELRDGELRKFTFDPHSSLGWKQWDATDLAGGEPEDNARIVLGVLNGEVQGAPRAAVALNAGGAIYLAGLAESIEEGVSMAESAINDGRAGEALDRLRRATARVTSTPPLSA
jgi:anthranilate phosphoribosyltransferase